MLRFRGIILGMYSAGPNEEREQDWQIFIHGRTPSFSVVCHSRWAVIHLPQMAAAFARFQAKTAQSHLRRPEPPLRLPAVCARLPGHGASRDFRELPESP